MVTSFIGFSSESLALAVSQATFDIKPHYREDPKLDEQQRRQVLQDFLASTLVGYCAKYSFEGLIRVF